MTSKTVRQRRSHTSDSSTSAVSLDQKLHDDLESVRQEALASGLTQEDFNICLSTAAKRSNLKLKPHSGGRGKKNGRRNCCSRVAFCFKVVWIGILLMLAFALLTAAYKPLTFYMHKLLHEKIYYFSRPIRLAIMGSLPYLEILGLDSFLTNDCILENPLLEDIQRCPCISVKRPTTLTLNGSPFPDDILQDPLRQVYVLRNATQIPSNFTLGSVIGFPEKYFTTPTVCWQVTSEMSTGVLLYRQLFDKELMKKLLRSKKPWAFTWQECPNDQNPSSLRQLLPPLTYVPPDIDTSTTTAFILTTQWAPSTHNEDMFQGAKLIAMHVIGGEVRIVPHPYVAACFEVCTGFREHPVLKAGDVFIFDPRLWTYEAYTWSRTALMYSIAIEYDTDQKQT